jgi:uncharacterized protein YeeX (DUF496 family)
MKNKFHILYTENCSAKEKSFMSMEEVQAFLRKFKQDYKQLEKGDSYWIDSIYYGIKIAENKSFK